MFQYIKSLFNFKDTNVELDITVAASLTLILISLLLTILSIWYAKELTTITTTAYTILGAHSYFSSKSK